MVEKVPGISECLRIMEQYEMLPHIRLHSIMVARVAECLLAGLQSTPAASGPANHSLRLDTVVAGALLHDIAKTPCLNDRCDHAAKGAEICFELGYPAIGRIVEEHVILREHDPARYERGIFSNREIVYYADKRVRHEEIVSLRDRLDYIISHYGRKNPHLRRLIHSNFNRCVELEKYLFSFIDFPPDELAERVMAGPSLLTGAEAAFS